MINRFFSFFNSFNSFTTGFKDISIYIKKSSYNVTTSYFNYSLEDAYIYLTLKIKLLLVVLFSVYMEFLNIYSFTARYWGASSWE